MVSQGFVEIFPLTNLEVNNVEAFEKRSIISVLKTYERLYRLNYNNIY